MVGKNSRRRSSRWWPAQIGEISTEFSQYQGQLGIRKYPSPHFDIGDRIFSYIPASTLQSGYENLYGYPARIA